MDELWAVLLAGQAWHIIKILIKEDLSHLCELQSDVCRADLGSDCNGSE